MEEHQRERTVPRAVGAPPLVKKALLLYRDYREFFYWDDLLWGEGGSVKRWSESKTEQIGRRDASLTSKVSEQAGYYLFIARWLQVAGRDLHKGCE